MHLYHHSHSRRNSNQLRTFTRVMRSNKKILWLAVLLFAIILVVRYYHGESQPYTLHRESKFVVGFDRKKITYDRDMPLIFIGGVPRSGRLILHNLL